VLLDPFSLALFREIFASFFSVCGCSAEEVLNLGPKNKFRESVSWLVGERVCVCVCVCVFRLSDPW
jgi:hypothetical protein